MSEIEFITIGDDEQLMCKGHIAPDVVIPAAIDYLRHEGNDYEDTIEVLAPKKVHHTTVRCVPVSPHDDNYGCFNWYLYTNQQPGRGAFKATIIDL